MVSIRNRWHRANQQNTESDGHPLIANYVRILHTFDRRVLQLRDHVACQNNQR
jgi:hypothetical protein